MTPLKSIVLLSTIAAALVINSTASAQQSLPFQHKVEVYAGEDGKDKTFIVRLEQPFLAGEFEQSNFLRLRSDDERAYLIYPKQAKFQQKHAEFYGRLRGDGEVGVELSYETISENLDGSRKINVRRGEITIPIPIEQTGTKEIFSDWARQQNAHFAHLLRYYPDESFFQYCLLQSQARYGVAPPAVPTPDAGGRELETSLYQFFTGSQAIQESLQQQTLRGSGAQGDLSQHVQSLSPPDIASLDYKALLAKQREQGGPQPQVHAAAHLVPADQYFVHFHEFAPLGELIDLTQQWGDSLLRLLTVRASEHRLLEKLTTQLVLDRDGLTKLFEDGVVEEIAVTGADLFVLEGADVTLLLKVGNVDRFNEAAAEWTKRAAEMRTDVTQRQFNYRGHQVTAQYTNDRVISSFVVKHDDYIVYSNSHRAVRRIIDAATGQMENLASQLNYQYVTSLLPPSEADDAGYVFGSEAFIRRQVAPAQKISEKRRLQCFNNLVMLNNASLFYRLEQGSSPDSLTDLVKGKYVDMNRVACPHGGAYAFDADRDMCTCSSHNRLRYLTPNVELEVLRISQDEAAEYNRYKLRYRQFWRNVFDPIAMRVTVQPKVKIETCVLPFANSSLYRDFQQWVDKNAQPIDTARIAPSAVVSLVAVPGRENAALLLRAIPGVSDVLAADPTLTDTSAWLGDRVSLHFCDGETVLEIDPTKLRASLPMLGNVPVTQQATVGAFLSAVNLPVYVSVDVENEQKATALLENLADQIFLQPGGLLGLPTQLDAYRLPEYKQHEIFVFSWQVYAVKVRLHVSLIGGQLVASTKPDIIHQVIDASLAQQDEQPQQAHLLLRFNQRALGKLYDEVKLYWAEKARLACHRNTISIYNLHRLYDVPVGDVGGLAEAKYGVRYFCPDHGTYHFDAERNGVMCSVHGNREHSHFTPLPQRQSSYERFMQSIDEVTAALRFDGDALIATVEIARR